MSSPVRAPTGEPPTLIIARRTRSDTTSSVDSNAVDWIELGKTEATETRNEASDESTAFLLARLEHENQALVKDPKSSFAARRRRGKHSRPPSIHVLKQLVDNPSGIEMALATPAEPPPMSELEFWAAVCKDFPQTILRLPTLTANKIKAGIPAPLRGVVWVSMAGARDTELGQEYERLVGEPSPYDDIIGKDIGRSFPEVAMFRERGGAGQQMLGRVLKCFSLHDEEIGYCQGLGFLVGPLLMQMGEKDAFCVLVRLMENYGLRSCFTPTLSGLHLRIYQLRQLLEQHIPEVSAHFASLGIEPAFLTSWLMSFYAITCPMPLLLRAWDIIFAEGAVETLFRIALAITKRNADRILHHTDFDDVMQLLLSKAVWEPYNRDGDEFVNDFMGLNALVTRESLDKLEMEFVEAQEADLAGKFGFLPDVTAAASKFLGRLWTANTPAKLVPLSPVKGSARLATPSRKMRRSHSAQSLFSDAPSMDIQHDDTFMSNRNSAALLFQVREGDSQQDKELHGQIEGLLTTLSELQIERSVLATQLQREREERVEDQRVMHSTAQYLRASYKGESRRARRRTAQYPLPIDGLPVQEGVAIVLEQIDQRLVLDCESRRSSRRSSALETKQRLRESLGRSKDQLNIEMSRSQALTQRLDEQETQTTVLREQLRDAQIRLQEGLKERTRLERTVQDFISRQNTENDRPGYRWTESMSENRSSQSSTSSNGTGLRELKLARTPQRTSSLLSVQPPPLFDELPGAAEDDLLAELVKSKTSEALARQELEELKAKLDMIRRTMCMTSPPVPNLTVPTPSRSPLKLPATNVTPLGVISGNEARPALPGGLTSGMGNLWGWSKRSFSGAVSPERT